MIRLDGVLTAAVAAMPAGSSGQIVPGAYAQDVTIFDVRDLVIDGAGATVQSLRLLGCTNVEVKNLTVAGPMSGVGQYVNVPATAINSAEPWATREAKVRAKYASFFRAYDHVYTTGVSVTASHGCVLTALSVHGHYVGIDASLADVDVAKCVVHSCGYGIWSRHRVVSCTVNDNFLSGIVVKAGVGAVVSGNSCSRNGLHGVQTSGRVERALVTLNECLDNGFYSETMQAPGSSAFNFYAAGPGNVCSYNLARGQLDPSGIDGNGYIADTSGTNGVVFDHDVSDGCRQGISITKTTGNRVTNCTLLNSTGTGAGTSRGAGLRYVGTGAGVVRRNLFAGNRVGISGLPDDSDFNLFRAGEVAVAYYGTPGKLSAHDVQQAFTLSGYVPSVPGYGAR